MMRCSFTQPKFPWAAFGIAAMWPLVCIRRDGHNGDHWLVDEQVDPYMVVKEVAPTLSPAQAEIE